MSDGTIKIPTWALPLVIGCLTVATSWGVLQTNVAHANAERERISDIAEGAAKKAQENGQLVAVNSEKLSAIVDSLARQEKIQEKTNEQIASLIDALLKR